MSTLRLRTFCFLSIALASGILAAEHLFFSQSLKIVDSRIVGDRVEYAYVGEALPALLEPNEVVERRAEASYTVYEGTDERGRNIYRTRSYAAPTFVQDGLAWHTVEYGRASHGEFLALTRPTTFQKIARVVATPTYAVQIFSHSGDESMVAFGDSWNAGHDAASGSQLSDDGDVGCGAPFADCFNVGAFSEDPGSFDIIRAFIPFDTSSIPAEASITAAALNVYVVLTGDGDNDGNDFITVVQTSQANYTTLALADFDQAGAINNPTEGVDSGDRRDITSISASAYLSFTLNATGIGWIAGTGETSGATGCQTETGITCLGLREGHDALDSSIVAVTETYITMSTSNETGTSQDPYLDITYIEGSAPTVTTDAASGVGTFSATLNGSITDDGGAAASTCGFAWGTNSGLSGGDTGTTTDSTCPGSTGSFSRQVSSLLDNTTYYFRAYATNAGGTGYGSIQSFLTGVSRKIRLYGRVQLYGGTHLR